MSDHPSSSVSVEAASPADASVAEDLACRVLLTLNYSFDSILGALVGPVFDRIASTLVDAFVKRAEKVYP